MSIIASDGAPAGLGFDPSTPDFMDDLTESRPANPKAAAFAQRIGEEIGADPNLLLHQYREQVDAVRDAGFALANQKAKMAALASRFGGRGNSASHWDAERSAMRARIAEARRNELLVLDKDELKAEIGSGSISEAYLDTYSRADAEYKRYLDRARVELEQYEEQQAKLSEAFAALDHEKGILSYLEARLSMARALSYAYGAEYRNT